jgi:multidrug efflux system membrane fusion protein
MPRFFRAHRVTAIVVLLAAAAWIVTGEFSAVGSEEAHAGQPAEAAPEAPKQAPLVRTVGAIVPQLIDHSRVIRISGATEADKRATLAARSSGIVAALTIGQGRPVEANAIVLSLEGEDVASGVITAEATLRQRAQELEVAVKLAASGNASDLALTRARADKAAAESALVAAQSAADRLNLRAPFAGIIDSVDVEKGEWVQAGTPIAVVLSLDPIVVRAEVSEVDLAAVEKGATARVRLVSGQEFDGIIRDIAREATAATRTFAVEVEIPNPDLTIPAGMTAEVQIMTDPVKAVAVPRSVITLDEAGTIGLRIVGADDIAAFAPVQLLDDTDQGMIVAGVPEGVRIIVAGQDLVRDGDRVNVTEVQPGASE